MSGMKLNDPATGTDYGIGPIRKATAVTPHNSNALSEPTRGLYLGTAGDLTVRMAGGTSDSLFVGAAAGYHELSVTHVRATGTTAANILALN
jgi:hypothetical protein